MSFYTLAQARRHWPELRFAANGECINEPPEWSKPHVRIIARIDAECVEQAIAGLIADDAVHVIAVSPAAVALSGDGEYWSFVATVIVQDRLSNAADELDCLAA